MQKRNILDILHTDQTVFSFKDLMLFSGETDADLVRRRISYCIKAGHFHHVRRGIYAKDKEYNKLELATKIFSPAYISFETVLASAGITFQFYSQIFVASYLSREIECEQQAYVFKKVKEAILSEQLGIENKAYAIACPERAVLDTLYLQSNYYFDNLAVINWEKIFSILPIYQNKRLVTTVNRIYREKS